MACGSTSGFSSSIRLSGTPVLSAIPPSVLPTCTVYVLLLVPLFAAFFFALTAAFFFAVVVDWAAGVVDAPSDADPPPLLPEPDTIARNATTTAIKAKGPRKRAGLLLVR